MADEERIESYIRSLGNNMSEVLKTIEKEALESGVPIIRKESQTFLEFLIFDHKPDKILEVGTATGFSASFMWEAGKRATGKGAKIITIEKYDKRIPIARENFKRVGAEEDITLLEGDAADILKELDDRFDFIFMDAAKAQYINYLPDVTRLLKKGGILLTDNVLRDGDICESRYAVTRRNRTIHTRMREYLYELTHNALYQTTVLNIGDGMALSLMK